MRFFDAGLGSKAGGCYSHVAPPQVAVIRRSVKNQQAGSTVTLEEIMTLQFHQSVEAWLIGNEVPERPDMSSEIKTDPSSHYI
jgi:hypothetical protein